MPHTPPPNHLTQGCFASESGTIYSRLFLLPIISPNSASTISSQVWSVAQAVVNGVLREWFHPGIRVTNFGVMPQEFLSAWSPFVLRSHLQRLHAGQENAQLNVPYTPMMLPDQAPRLAFVLVGASRRSTWPTTQEFPAYIQRAMLDKVRFALQMGSISRCDPTDAAPLVLPLQEFCAGHACGLQYWFVTLLQTVGISGYGATPSEHSSDVIKLVLRIPDPLVCEIQLELRRHQLGDKRLFNLLRGMKSLVPFLDAPQDAHLQANQ